MLEEFGILIAAAALSAAGVIFAMVTATTARRVADIIAFVGGGIMLAVAALHLAPGGATAVRTAAIAALAVLSVHSMADGAVYGAAFAHNHGTGMLASMGLIFHEAPEGVVAFMLPIWI